jgi:hypothetical protein
MQTLKLDKPWTYRTPETTIDYPAGEHQVKNEIHAAAEKAGVVKEVKADGGGAPKAGAPSAADASQGG